MSKTLYLNDSTAPRGNYLHDLEALINSGALAGLKKGAAYRLEVRHDADCPLLAGGTCNCEPEYALQEGAAR